MSRIQNERTKLTATWVNALGSGTIVIGGLTPTATLINGPAPKRAKRARE